jgi:hypothetical protein
MWANTIVEQYADEHPRATELSVEYLGMSSNNIADLLAKGSKSWEKYKAFIKLIEQALIDNSYQKEKLGKWDLGQMVLKQALNKCIVNKCWVLTRIEFLESIKEHGLNGGKDLERSEGSLPSIGGFSYVRSAKAAMENDQRELIFAGALVESSLGGE